jgi:iron complex outermembrane receptor protein
VPLSFKHLRAATRAASLVLSAILPGMSQAAQAYAEDQELSRLPLEDLMQMPVVTAASHFEQLISEAPSSVVVLSAADIRDFGWRTLADALATLPGLYVANDRNYSYLGARGFLRPGDYNSRFLLMIDGVRTNDAVFDQALIGTEGLLDMDMVKRIEFVPGPGSAVHGSNALFGVINIITRDGSGLPGLQAVTAAGSERERRARISYGWHAQDGADVLLAASSFARDGRDLYFPEFDSPGQHGGIAHRLDYDRAQNLLLKAGYQGWQLAASHVSRTKGVPTGSYGAVFDTPNSTRDTQTSAALSWTGLVAPRTELTARLTWNRADYLGLGYYPGAHPAKRAGSAGPVLNVDGDHARWYGASVHATFSGLPRQKLVLGAELGRDDRLDQFNYDLEPYAVVLDDRRSSTRQALFAEDEVRLPAGFLVNAGLRLDHIGARLHRASPRVALLYKASPRDTVKLIYGSAFRAPNAYEMYYTAQQGDGAAGNPTLQPERIATREAVFEHAMAGAGHATLSLFRHQVSDLINQQADDATGQLVFRNLDHASVRGAEAAFERQFGGVRLRASYTWQLAQGSSQAGTETWLADSPRHLAKLNLVTPLRGEARLGTELLCSSARLGEQGVVGGYCVANLTLNLKPSLPRVLRKADLSLSAFNALAKRYADVAGPAFVQDALQRQGRTLYARLAYRF